MIRLAIIGAPEQRIHALTPRLRGVALSPEETCEALVFFEISLPTLERALQASKPVLIATEHGPARTMLRPLGEMLTRFPDADVAIVNPDRYLPSRQIIHQHLQAGKLGEPGLVRIHRWEAKLQNIAMLRDLDTVSWLFKAMPRTIFAVAHGRGAVVHLGFATGGMALIDHAAVPKGGSYQSLSVIGSAGAAYADDQQNTQLAFGGGPAQAIRTDEGVGQWVALAQEFADRVAQGEKAKVDADWPALVALSESVQTSLDCNAPVEV